MTCANPDCSNSEIFVRGYCQGCYHRLRRTGSLTRRNVINRGVCMVEGCDRKAFAKNLCSMHYQSGKHPLYSVWRNLRARSHGDYPAAWDIFDTFLSVIGQQPSAKAQLRRPDPEKPWSVDNFEWREPVGISYKFDHKAYSRKWDLKKKYDITPEQFDTMLLGQNNGCAICGCDITGTISEGRRKPKLRAIVDHDHRTGKARGLLCDPCNKGLGMFDDNITNIESAIAYLKSHQS